jgi:N-acetylneuraminic acid mutarotase
MAKKNYVPLFSVSLLAFFVSCLNPASADKKKATSIEIWYNTVSVDVGDTTQLTGVVLYSDKTIDSNVIWHSSNSAIAEVSSSGIVRGVSKGKCTVTAKSVTDPSLACSFTMSVETPLPWAAKAPMNNGREGVSLCVLKGKIYAIGGSSSSGAIGKIEEYDTATDAWREKSVNIDSLGAVAAVACGNYIYIVGKPKSSSIGLTAYDPATDSLYRKSGFQSGSFWFGVGSANGKIYIIGGAFGSSKLSRTSDDTGGITATATATSFSDATYEYDTVKDTWTQKASLPIARSHVAITSLKGEIYAMGGQNGDFFYSRVDVFNPEFNDWYEANPMPSTRWGAAAVTLNDHIFVIGGVMRNTYVSNSLFEYDPPANFWSMRTPFSDIRLHLGAGALGTAIFIAGGWNDQGYLASTLKGN